MEHFCVKFGDPSCIGFSRYRVEKQKKTQMPQKTLPMRLPLAWVNMIDSRLEWQTIS